MRWVIERARDLDGEGGGREVSDLMGGLVAGELASALEELDQITDRKERWQLVQEISRELSRLRREDHQDKRLQIVEAKWEHAFERECEESYVVEEKEKREKLEKLFWGVQRKQLMAKMLGGGEQGEKWADWLFRVQNGIKMPEWWKPEGGGMGFGEATTVDPTKIRPNPGKSG